MENFAERLRTIRKNTNMTQVDVAKKTGLSQSNINTWERGRSLPLPEGLIKLADCFGCSVDYILGRESEDSIIIVNDKQKSEIEELYEKLDRQNKIMVLGYITALLQKQNNA